jgi:hypothetical protein
VWDFAAYVHRQVQAEQQATLDAAVLAAQAATKVTAAAQLEAAAQREANLQVKAAAAAKAHAGVQHEFEVALQEIAQLKATAVREAAPPGAAFRASGAGSIKCNGWYKQFGTFNGKPEYYKVGDLDTCLVDRIARQTNTVIGCGRAARSITWKTRLRSAI